MRAAGKQKHESSIDDVPNAPLRAGRVRRHSYNGDDGAHDFFAFSRPEIDDRKGCSTPERQRPRRREAEELRKVTHNDPPARDLEAKHALGLLMLLLQAAAHLYEESKHKDLSARPISGKVSTAKRVLRAAVSVFYDGVHRHSAESVRCAS